MVEGGILGESEWEGSAMVLVPFLNLEKKSGGDRGFFFFFDGINREGSSRGKKSGWFC